MIERHHVAVIGAGPIGLELAVALKQAGIDYVQLDAGQIGSTIEWYPPQMLFHSSSDRLALAGMPIQTANQQKITREEFLAYLRALVLNFGLTVRTYERVLKIEKGFILHTTASQIRADIIVLAIGAFHAPRLIDVPGEDLPHVSHYLRDPHHYFGKRLLIVGGRNSAVEAAVRCHRAGADVTLAYRGEDFDPKVVKFWLLPEVRALIRDGHVRFLPRTCVRAIEPGRVLLDDWVPADFVLLMTGYRQDPTLFEMLGVQLQGAERAPLHDPATMETNVPGVFIAGTAVAGTPPRKVSVIVETCHVHVPRIVAAITGRRVALPDGALDD
ncbi:MAG TPA: NAD(P)-binding domain-containing protein [Thermoanaerobaculia bacterium]|nr:NAD(P)-binding domain-containing protein [Thermoanaerobaculia bacterium]